jgi:hypothetical protein
MFGQARRVGTWVPLERDTLEAEDEMHDGPGWLPDPEHDGQERYWDGSGWTDQVRPGGSPPGSRLHLPEHVPELQRALAAATADIDEVEDRLSTLFDRTGNPAGAGAVHRAPAAPPPPRPEGALHEEFDTMAADGVDDVELADAGADVEVDADVEGEGYAGGDGDADTGADGEGDDDAFAELDEALAAEAPDKPERRFFRRRSS